LAHRPCGCCGGTPACTCTAPCTELFSYDYYVTRPGSATPPGPPATGVIVRDLTEETYCCDTPTRVTLYERRRRTLFYAAGGSCLFDDETRTYDGAPSGSVTIDRHWIQKNPYSGCTLLSDVTDTIDAGAGSCDNPWQGSLLHLYNGWPVGLDPADGEWNWGWAWATKTAYAGEVSSRIADPLGAGYWVIEYEWHYTREDPDCSPPECEAEACCLPEGVCKDLLPADCLAAGGIPQGQGTSCGGPATGVEICETLPTGACCQPEGACSIESESACGEIEGGVYLGDGTVCADCEDVPTGACCRGETCTIETEAGCTMATDPGGVYLGDGTTCAGDPCALGACCITETGVCSQTTESACDGAGGVWYDGLTCGDPGVPCGDVNGACCLEDGTCTNTTASGCFAMGGVHFAEATTCDFVDCGIGACCCLTSHGWVCDEVPEALCTGGCVFSPGATCAETDCEALGGMAPLMAPEVGGGAAGLTATPGADSTAASGPTRRPARPGASTGGCAKCGADKGLF
jgi:hypothetical protein